MTDYLGQELAIGDKVVTVIKNYREFITGEVIAFTPCQVRVALRGNDTFLTTPKFVIKINK